MRSRKLLFIGPPAAGKTSLRKFFFDAVPSEKLLAESEPPTKAMKFHVHDYLYSYMFDNLSAPEKEDIPIKLAIVDTSGQEIDRLLGEQRERAFPSSDIVFFVFDIGDWFKKENREYLLDLFTRIHHIIVEMAPDAQVCVFCHKIDKIGLNEPNLEKIRGEIKEIMLERAFNGLEQVLVPRFFMTSIKGDHAKECFFTLLELVTGLFTHLL